MGVFDKLKNIFFEEEEEEIEEPVKKVKKTSVAKKIDLPDMPKFDEEKSQRELEIEEEVVEKVEKKGQVEREKKNETFKFPMDFNEDDFKVDEPVKKKEVKKEVPLEEEFNTMEKPKYSFEYKKEENVAYKGAVPYEGKIDIKKEQKVFRPTPIISPIYGILDKNYKKEDIVTKKEFKTPSSYSKKVDLDSVREKAYGDLANDLDDMLKEIPNDKEIEIEIEETELYDLNTDESPQVSKVTMGDAEEYYNDLGLEYNVDYKDHAKEKATGRRSQKEESPIVEEEKTEDNVETNDGDEEIENNLFDLIDSMYSDKED